MKKLLPYLFAALFIGASYGITAELSDLAPVDADNTFSASNAGFPENMAPSSVNNAARALEGMLSRYLADSASALIVTSESSTVYSVTANQTVSALEDGMVFLVELTPANAASPTLNISNTGAVRLIHEPGTSLKANAFVAGQRVIVSYDSGNNRWQILGGVAPPVSSAYSDPLTTRGDVLVRGSSATQRLAKGVSGHVLLSNGADTLFSTVASPGIAVGAVTKTHLAPGNVGSLITWNTSQIAQEVTAGESGRVLTSNGAGQYPTYQAIVSSNFYKAVSEAFTDVKVSVTSTSYTATSNLLAADNDAGDTVELRFSSYVAICRVGGSQTAKYGLLGLYRGTVASGTLIFESSVGRIHAASSSSTCGYYPMNFIYVDDSGSTDANQHYEIGIKSSVSTNIRIEEPANYPATNEEAVLQAFTRN